MCCGNKREALHERRTLSVTPRPAPSATEPPRVPVVYRGTGAYLVTGPHSREVYHFSSGHPVQWADAKDVGDLLRTGLFRAKH